MGEKETNFIRHLKCKLVLKVKTMKNQLKPLIPLVDKLTKGNPILRLIIYLILILCFVLIITSTSIHFVKLS